MIELARAECQAGQPEHAISKQKHFFGHWIKTPKLSGAICGYIDSTINIHRQSINCGVRPCPYDNFRISYGLAIFKGYSPDCVIGYYRTDTGEYLRDIQGVAIAG
jgi:hypothetical protein